MRVSAISGNENSNKPTCSNGYATLFLLEYYTVCDQSEKSDVLAFARRLYTWVYNNLRDPADGCYWNDAGFRLGEQNQVDLQHWCNDLKRCPPESDTEDQKYLNEAIESAQGAYSYFVPCRQISFGIPQS